MRLELMFVLAQVRHCALLAIVRVRMRVWLLKQEELTQRPLMHAWYAGYRHVLQHQHHGL